MPPLPYNLISVLISVNFRMRTVISKKFNLRLCESRVLSFLILTRRAWDSVLKLIDRATIQIDLISHYRDVWE